MISEQELFLKSFQEKVVRLKNRAIDLEKRNALLTEELQKEQNSTRELESKMAQLEEKYNSLKIAGSVADGSSDLGELKNTVNRMMREIDECIAFLND